MENIIHVKGDRRFELKLDDDIAYIEYVESQPKVWSLTHTWIPVSQRGKGAAAKLTAGVFEWCRDNGVKIIPVCPYIVTFLKRYPEWEDSILYKG